MNIGISDVDSTIPNLALMKLSAWQTCADNGSERHGADRDSRAHEKVRRADVETTSVPDSEEGNLNVHVIRIESRRQHEPTRYVH